MKPPPILIALVIIMLASGCRHYNTPEAILKQTVKQVRKIERLTYKTSIAIKDFDARDTSFTTVSVWAQKMPSDPLLGFKFRMETREEEYIYNPPHLYHIRHPQKTLVKINAREQANAFADLPFQDYIFRELLYDEFYQQIQQPGYRTRIVGNNAQFWILRLDYPPEEEIGQMYRKLWIGKHDFLPGKMVYRVSYNDQTYYQETKVLRLLTPVELEETFFTAEDLKALYP
jgi:hypothetical protein